MSISNIIVQVANPRWNIGTDINGNSQDWQDLQGLISLKVQRGSGCIPATFEFTCTSDEALDSGESRGGLNRFYPFLQVRVLEDNGDTSTSDVHCRQYIYGRIDSAVQTQDQNNMRVWKVTGRDLLSVLSDNYIDKGKWYNTVAWDQGLTDHSHLGRGNLFVNGEPIVDGMEWSPSYTGNWLYVLDTHVQPPILPSPIKDPKGQVGEFRSSIATDLSMNVIADGVTGLSGLNVADAPNSERVELSWDQTSNIKILDAIRDLARTDPWIRDLLGHNNQPLSGTNVTTKMLVDAGFPIGSGIGAELSIICNTASNNGRSVQYFARGDYTRRGGAVIKLSYGNPPNVTTDINQIIEYSFSKDGTDVYSRARTVGKQGVTTLSDNKDQVGTGLVTSGMENTWDPTHGKFRIRKEVISNVQSAGTDGTFFNTPSSGTTTVSSQSQNYLQEAALAELATGQQNLMMINGGVNVGSVSVIGLPNELVSNIPGVVTPGDLAEVYIPQLGLLETDPLSNSGGMLLCIDGWTFSWPECITTYDLSRVPFSNFGNQLIQNQRATSGTQAAVNVTGFYCDWQAVNSDGKQSFYHGLGRVPATVAVVVAMWDGSSFDDKGFPIPLQDTMVFVNPSTSMNDTTYGFVRVAYGFNASANNATNNMDTDTVNILLHQWIANYSSTYAGFAGALQGEGSQLLPTDVLMASPSWISLSDYRNLIVRAIVS